MASLFNQPDRTFEPKPCPPEGMHPARLYSIVDLGTHEDTYQGVSTLKHKVCLTWELYTEPMMDDGRPYVIGKEYTITAGKFGPYIAKTSALYDTIKTWMKWDEKDIKIGKLGKLIGQTALITVNHEKGKTDPTKVYSKMGPVLPLMKGMTCPDQINPSIVYELNGDGFDALPEWQQFKIKKCKELNGGVPPRIREDGTASAETHSDIPF